MNRLPKINLNYNKINSLYRYLDDNTTDIYNLSTA